MKADKTYSHINVCPKTGDGLSENNIYYSDGICPSCGHNSDGTITHRRKIVGRFIRPSLWERIWEGKQTKFMPKEEEDKVWNGLQQ